MATVIPGAAEAPAALSVSDTDFRGETIYFIVVDRFFDGNPNNMGQRQDLNDPSHQDWGKYWGGDLQGVLDKLDYLQGMGVTAIWVTPLFEQVEGLVDGHAPNHGYWAQDFKRINERWVNSPEEVRLFSQENTIFDKLIAELHRRGMKFILDIVCNHSTPPTDVGTGKLYNDGELIADHNDDKRNWYHHYGEVTNWEDEWQVQNCDLCGLATFNENNLEYRDYIKGAIQLWLDRGVDALRIDTVKHMPEWFWQEFTSDMQSSKPSIFIFGEWIHSSPKNETSVHFANYSGMTILDFGFSQAIRDCLGERKADGFQLVHEIIEMDGVYRGANDLVTFFENHDMPRLQSLGADNDMLRLATVLILTSRGIPCLYYGSEQYLHDDTDGGNDPYNRPMMSNWTMDTDIYRVTSILSAERATNSALQFGRQKEKYVTADIYAYTRTYRDWTCLIVLNRGGASTIAISETWLPDGTYECLLTGQTIHVAEGSAHQFELKGCDALVFASRGSAVQATSLVRIQLNGVATNPGDTVVVSGNCAELGKWDLSLAFRLEYVNANTWFGEIAFEESAGQSIAYKLIVLPMEGAPLRENRTTRRRLIAQKGITKWRDVWEE